MRLLQACLLGCSIRLRKCNCFRLLEEFRHLCRSFGLRASTVWWAWGSPSAAESCPRGLPSYRRCHPWPEFFCWGSILNGLSHHCAHLPASHSTHCSLKVSFSYILVSKRYYKDFSNLPRLNQCLTFQARAACHSCSDDLTYFAAKLYIKLKYVRN